MSQFPSAYFLNRSGNKQKGTHNTFWFSEVLTDCCNGFLAFAVGEASCLISLLPQLLLWVLPLTHCSENVFLPSRRTLQPPAPRTHQPSRTEVEGKVLPDFSPGMGQAQRELSLKRIIQWIRQSFSSPSYSFASGDCFKITII